MARDHRCTGSSVFDSRLSIYASVHLRCTGSRCRWSPPAVETDSGLKDRKATHRQRGGSMMQYLLSNRRHANNALYRYTRCQEAWRSQFLYGDAALWNVSHCLPSRILVGSRPFWRDEHLLVQHHAVEIHLGAFHDIFSHGGDCAIPGERCRGLDSIHVFLHRPTVQSSAAQHRVAQNRVAQNSRT